MRAALRWVGLAALASALHAGCVMLDVSQPIALVMPDDPIAPWEHEMNRAARCWNRQVGSQLLVGPSAAAAQRVEVGFDELVCAEAHGLTRIADSVSVWICPPKLYIAPSGSWGSTIEHKPSFYDVFVHELGHVLNIRGHGGVGIMGRGLSFARDDQRLFHEANADFEPAESCAERPWDRTLYGECDCPP